MKFTSNTRNARALILPREKYPSQAGWVTSSCLCLLSWEHSYGPETREGFSHSVSQANKLLGMNPWRLILKPAGCLEQRWWLGRRNGTQPRLWGSFLSLMLKVSYGVQILWSSNGFVFSWETDAHEKTHSVCCTGEEHGCSHLLPMPPESIGEPSLVWAQKFILVTFGLHRTCAGWPPRCSHSVHATPSRQMSSAMPCVCGSSSQEKSPSRISSQVGPAAREQFCFPVQFTESLDTIPPYKDNYSSGDKRSCIVWGWASHSENITASLWI